MAPPSSVERDAAAGGARQRLLDALNRSRLVEELVHKQAMRQHDRVELLVSRQRRSELSKLLLPLADREIGQLLSELVEGDRLALWSLLPLTRADGVLMEVDDDLRESLVALMPAQAPDLAQHATAFALADGKLVQWRIDGPDALNRRLPVWVDLIDARSSERTWVERHFGLRLPDPGAVTDLESSARFYVDEDGAFHLYSDFLLAGNDTSRSIRVAFLLCRGCLISLRAEEMPVFRLQRVRALSYAPQLHDGVDILLDLYAADVEYSAGALESVDAVLESVSRRVLNAPLSDQAAVSVLGQIGVQETLNGRIRRNLMDTRRALSFLGRAKLLHGRRVDDAAQVGRDIDSLDGHTAFLFDKINFLLDATVGFININQNRVIRLFSVASVALLPPTLVASIYGMNFRHFPALSWDYGYPFALGVMALTVAVPLLYFRRRGWLR